MDNVKGFPGKVVGVAGDGIGGTDGVTGRPPQANLSFVEDKEQIQAQSIIDEQFRELTKGFLGNEYPGGVTFREHARLTRYFAAVKIYIRPEELKVIDVEGGGKQTLYLPDTIRAEDKYQACTGLVVSLGPQAFQDKDGNPRGSKYRVGDWIVFPRTDIIRLDFCGIALGILTDDRAVLVTDEPRFWSQGIVGFKA
jgi:hypothetical protein